MNVVGVSNTQIVQWSSQKVLLLENVIDIIHIEIDLKVIYENVVSHCTSTGDLGIMTTYQQPAWQPILQMAKEPPDTDWTLVWWIVSEQYRINMLTF